MQDRADTVFDAFVDMIIDRVAERYNLGPGKTLYTIEEVAERFSLSTDAVLKRVHAGEFGDVVRLGKRCYRVTAEGVWKFERDHLGPAHLCKEAAAPARRGHRRDPGPI